MSPIRGLWLRLQASLWFVPTLVVAGCMALAVLLVESHGWVEADLAARWPRLFGAGTDGARSMLSAIATSMITVAGVVFSVTIVALSLASSQYSPRVLRNFMSDRPTQLVLGMFVGIFAYCLVVLRTVRSDDDGPGFLPSLAVMGGVVLALFGVAMLIYFIHHVATSIQVSSILQRIARDTGEAIDRLFPEALGRGLPADESCLDELPTRWHDVPAPATGYLVGVDDDGLLTLASRLGRVVQLAHCIGDFVIEGQPLVRVSGGYPLDGPEARALCGLFAVQPQRTVHQDAAYGLQQIVDVALKALSPGINDPATALMCIDHLGALLLRLGGRRIPSPCRSDGGGLRVVARGPGFEDLAALALDPIAEHARGETAVLGKLLHTLSMLGAGLRDPRQLHALRRRLALLCEAIAHGVDTPARREPLLERARMLGLRLQEREADAKAHGPIPERET
ncbi:DUF2254 domain-containing protein [Azohydromonas caseinilytica]|uniref:DUF2254 domain-containing protein n=1 Tax=Azohydromonas caseinilytica TaxID=2728836 RepID=A0A848FG98_9BURK|nr:DUF2254 domain-containing protein [Azohydromonas caseinilytica]NML18166.1 DUF2254 domain-containing protein [Azohydromonas caseinilytica]